MTKEEIKKRIEEIKRRIEQLDIQQYSKKIRINSAYGAISSYMNPAGDVDIANAITLMSQAAIRQINEIAKQFVKLKNPSISAKDLENVIIANDTDSSMLTLSNCGVKICENNTVTEEGYKLAQEFDDYINNEFESWMKNTTNTNKCTLYFKREKICDYGVYLKKKGKNEEAKKNYILHILDDEGIKKPKFKYTGVKFARSVLPQELKTAAKKIVESLVLTQNKAETDKLLQQLFEDYKNMSLDVISLIQRCNNMEKYNSKVPDDNNLGKRNWVSGTPGHIRAAMNYNAVLDKLKLTGYEKIKSGDLAKIIFVEKNKFGIDKIAYLDTWPNEFNDVFKIDYRTSFIKTVYDEIKRIYDSVDWPSFNPADNYVFSLFDILELGED